MDVVIYAENIDRKTEALRGLVAGAIQGDPIEIDSLDALFLFLRSKVTGEVIIVFMIYSETELDRLLESKSRLFNTRFIIILLDEGDGMVTKALALHPRFLSFKSRDYTDVGRVLNKMMKREFGQ